MGVVREFQTASPGIVWASLCDFETNSAALAPEHIEWLGRRIVTPYLQHHTPGMMWIRGRASRRWTGAHSDASRASHNLSLSQRRAQAVELYLEQRGTSCEVFPLRDVRGTGHSVTVGGDENDSLDRAVEIKFQATSISVPHVPPFRKPPPGPKIPILHHTPPGPIVSNRFRLRVIFGLSASIEVGVGAMNLEIEDLQNGWAAIYDLRELHVDLGVGSPVSVSAAGPWHTFLTSMPVGVGQFGGLVRLGGYGASMPSNLPFGPRSFSWGTSFLVLRPHIVGLNAIRIEPFSASCEAVTTPCIGISYGVGHMSILGRALPKDQLPFPHNIRH